MTPNPFESVNVQFYKLGKVTPIRLSKYDLNWFETKFSEERLITR